MRNQSDLEALERRRRLHVSLSVRWAASLQP